MSSAALRPKRAFYRAQGLVIRGLRPYSLWGHPQSARPGLLGQLQGRGKGAQVLPGNSRPPPASPQAVRAAGVWCGGPPGHPGAPLPTRAARRSGVKQVLQSSAASVTLRGRGSQAEPPAGVRGPAAACREAAAPWRLGGRRDPAGRAPRLGRLRARGARRSAAPRDLGRLRGQKASGSGRVGRGLARGGACTVGRGLVRGGACAVGQGRKHGSGYQAPLTESSHRLGLGPRRTLGGLFGPSLLRAPCPR